MERSDHITGRFCTEVYHSSMVCGQGTFDTVDTCQGSLSNSFWTGTPSQSTRMVHFLPKLAILKLISLASLASFCFWSKSALTPGRSNQAGWAARCACSFSWRRIIRGAQGQESKHARCQQGTTPQSNRLVCLTLTTRCRVAFVQQSWWHWSGMKRG